LRPLGFAAAADHDNVSSELSAPKRSPKTLTQNALTPKRAEAKRAGAPKCKGRRALKQNARLINAMRNTLRWFFFCAEAKRAKNKPVISFARALALRRFGACLAIYLRRLAKR